MFLKSTSNVLFNYKVSCDVGSPGELTVWASLGVSPSTICQPFAMIFKTDWQIKPNFILGERKNRQNQMSNYLEKWLAASTKYV